MDDRNLACPTCGETRFVRVEQCKVAVTLDGETSHTRYPTGWILFACSCATRVQPLMPLVESTGSAIKTERTAKGIVEGVRIRLEAENRDREAARQKVARAETVLRAWSDQPVTDRIYNSGAGWRVQVPTLDPPVPLDGLDVAVVGLYQIALAEAETEAARRTHDDEIQRSVRAAAHAAAMAGQIREDAAVARQRRQDASELF